MGIDALAQVATGSVLCISSSGPDPTHGGQGLREGLVSHPDSLSLAREALVGRHYPAPLRPTVTSPFTQRPAVTGIRGDISPPEPTCSGFGCFPSKAIVLTAYPIMGSDNCFECTVSLPFEPLDQVLSLNVTSVLLCSAGVIVKMP